MGFGTPRRPIDTSGPKTTRWLADLPCFPAAAEMLRAGATIALVCDYVADQSPDLAVTRKALYRALQDYRNSLPPLEAIRAHAPTLVASVRDQIAEGGRELDELWSLYEVQLGRIGRGLDAERRADHPLKTVTKDVDVAALMLERIARIKIALGAADLVYSKQSATDDDARSGPVPVVESRVSRLLADPEARRRAAELVERMAALDGKVGLDKVRDRLRVVQGTEG